MQDAALLDVQFEVAAMSPFFRTTPVSLSTSPPMNLMPSRIVFWLLVTRFSSFSVNPVAIAWLPMVPPSSF